MWYEGLETRWKFEDVFLRDIVSDALGNQSQSFKFVRTASNIQSLGLWMVADNGVSFDVVWLR